MKLSVSALMVAFILMLGNSGAADQQPSLAPMLKRVLPAVVSISSDGGEEEQFGSGVIVDSANGYILTNRHLVENANRVSVTLGDGRTLHGRVIGKDAETDLAVLSVHAGQLVSLPFGASSALEVGDYVVAVGNPYGLGQTVTLGIVSALGRSGFGSNAYEDFIQTDASINPGSSGGALINLDGELIGIPSAIVSPAGSNVGIGLAIPIEVAKLIMERLIKSGEIRRGKLGVVAQDLTPELATALRAEVKSGAVVTQVLPGSSAEKAKLAVGDIIAAIDDKTIASATGLHNAVALLDAEAQVVVSLWRDGKLKQISATLTTIQQVEGNTYAGIGLLADVVFASPPPRAESCDAVSAVAIAEVGEGSLAQEAGLKAGDLVVSFGLKPVSGPQDVVELAAAADGSTLLLGICRDGGVQLLVVHGEPMDDPVR